MTKTNSYILDVLFGAGQTKAFVGLKHFIINICIFNKVCKEVARKNTLKQQGEADEHLVLPPII